MAVIVDTGVFFAYYSLRDKHHLDSLALIIHLVEGKWGRAFITNHILDETLNILKYRISAETAKAFIETFIGKNIVKVIYVEEELEKEALKIFLKNIHRKGFSYTDATTVATIKEYNIENLITYDTRSFTNLVKNIIGTNYWNTLPTKEQRRIKNIISEHIK
ncbi:MAG: hypothetical protein DRO23_08280 [Thermoprotei archaeon]|nr:MAG: hypothetical protein DRO23_08280 [Thermoprotei archaeon]